MNWKSLLLALALADFAAISGYAVYQHGYLGFFELATANWVSITLLADVVIALGLFSIWMWNDARERGMNAVPYLVMTATLGSVGPLLYLIVRETRGATAPALAPASR